jgi:hypothetical protein
MELLGHRSLNMEATCSIKKTNYQTIGDKDNRISNIFKKKSQFSHKKLLEIEKKRKNYPQGRNTAS